MPRSPILEEVLRLVVQRLNDSFHNRHLPSDHLAVLSNLADLDGGAHDRLSNKLVVYVANIQQDTTISSRNAPVPTGAAWVVQGYPTVYVNLLVMLYANFAGTSYPDGLGMISHAIHFFQENPSFDPQSLPGLPQPIDKLAFEMVSLSPADLSYYMTLAGAKYLPCVCYKVRMIPFQGGAIQAQVPAARGFGAPADPMDLPEEAPNPLGEAEAP